VKNSNGLLLVLKISRIIEWLPQRKGAKDDLRLPSDAQLVRQMCCES
jgi:hypothetical protein